jgi:hypothetical protein
MRNPTVGICLLVFIILTFSPHFCFSQCNPNWKPTEGVPGVADLTSQIVVSAVTKWDPDANGPLPERLVFGGVFSVAGDVRANNIASWDGNSWQSFGSGFDTLESSYIPTVCALTVYNGKLVAGGYFDTSGGVGFNNIAAWDVNSNSWIPRSAGGFNGIILALTSYNGQLIAGGWFTTSPPPGLTANHIAAWRSGEGWLPLGSGMNGSVTALTVYNGQLIAGGYFTTAGGLSASSHVAAWNGSNWQPLNGGSISNGVLVLTVYNNQLIAATSTRAYRWTGSLWQDIGTIGGTDFNVALTVYNNELIAGGLFTEADGVSANRIAAWNGTEWHALGS